MKVYMVFTSDDDHGSLADKLDRVPIFTTLEAAKLFCERQLNSDETQPDILEWDDEPRFSFAEHRDTGFEAVIRVIDDQVHNGSGRLL